MIDGLRMAYQIDGPDNAPTLVLIHCLGANIRMWDPQIDALCPHLRVVRYDIRGHGNSEASKPPLTIERLGRDLLALMDHLQIARAHVCGLSLGGLIAQYFVIHHPERVERAVFANTAARLGTTASWEARIGAIRAGGMASIRDMVIGRFFSAAFRNRHPDVAKTFGDILQATRADGYIAACTALRDADLRQSVSSIHVPTLVIAGGLDEATPQAQSAELAAAIGGSEFVVLQEAAHLSNVEQPDEFSRHLMKFFGVQP